MRIVLIGCDRGLGLELVREFASGGHQVIAGILAQEAPAGLLALESGYEGRVMHVTADVTDETQMKQAADFVSRQFGQVDALVHIAGILLDSDRKNLLHETDVKDLRKTFDVNTIGPILAVKFFYPLMVKNVDAPFVIITSEGCDILSCGTWIPAYALSKCAATKIPGIMNASVKDVRFYAMHPGRMKTVMGRETFQIEASEASSSIYQLISGGEIKNKGSWYIDYKGMDMHRR
jgi:NAD(P)-dependent dehydrogenase (short-subunit alcohol dehydrogenase family)